MYTKEVEIINATGLHARPASQFVKLATKFKSDIKIFCNERSGLAKSILNIMAVGAHKGAILKIEAEGDDEHQAVDTLVEFVASGCGE